MGNKTSVVTTGIGSAIAVILIFVIGEFAITLTAEKTALLVGAFTVIFNYFIPAKK
ncbi:MAG: hypothetical protein GY804_01150 [Alphaproteobacteria bacterium]|nr:hypothetical protein [Alphaproteobacteria bacterium]